jgi:hypothetical protein
MHLSGARTATERIATAALTGKNKDSTIGSSFKIS